MQSASNSYATKQRENEAAHPLRALASAVIHRLETPLLRSSQRDAATRYGRGSNARKKVVRSYTPAGGKKTVGFGGFDSRPLSETDRADVTGAVALALCAAPTDARTLCHGFGLAYRSEVPEGTPPALAVSADLARHGECFPCRARLGLVPLSFATWKQLFTAARATLGMKRKTARENLSVSMEGLETAIQAGQSADLLAAESARREREALKAAEKAALTDTRARVAREARHLHTLLCAAWRAEKASGERKAKSNFRTSLAHLRRAIRATLGEGHAHEKTRQAAYERDRVFRAYLGKGEAQAALERESAQAARESEEAARLMLADCNW